MLPRTKQQRAQMNNVLSKTETDYPFPEKSDVGLCAIWLCGLNLKCPQQSCALNACCLPGTKLVEAGHRGGPLKDRA